MIKRRTTFILGAGASAPYGYPTAMELRQDIIDGLGELIGECKPGDPSLGSFNPRTIPGAVYSYYGFTYHREAWIFNSFVGPSPSKTRHKIDEQLIALANALEGSGSSVDALLEHRDELEEVGKIAIAACLLRRERRAELKPRPSSENERWYEYLFNLMTNGIRRQDFPAHQLSIITFNYDRSLEYFFFDALKAAYDLDDEAATDLLRSIKIVHVHGQLGKPHFVSPEDGRDYGYDYSSDSPYPRDVLAQCVREIQIVHEQNSETGEFEQAHKLIGQAEVIAFLGFGYYPLNVKRLQLSHFEGSYAGVYGTVYKLKDAEIIRARELIHEAMFLPSLSWSRSSLLGPTLEDEDCLTFLRNTLILK